MGATVEVRFERPPSDDMLDRTLDALLAAGADALELVDIGPQVAVLALFHALSPDEARDAARSTVGPARIQPITIEARAAEVADWGSTWADARSPLTIGPLTVVPSGRSAKRPGRDGAYVLSIDPARAFGSGLHATTALCLERIVELSPIAGSVLDVGTGTGILALAALILGAIDAVGTDTDPDALEVAAANAAHNALSDRIRFSAAAPDAQRRQFSLIVANLVAAPLVDLAMPIVRAIAPGGTVLLSGCRSDQASEVAEAYRRLGLRHLATRTKDGWALIELATSW